jgi:methylenetetrahydrofolate--tRNA-(uracil-5-)-methyltransferase
MAGMFAAAEQRNEELRLPPATTALGALLAHITGGHLADENASGRSYQPMNINFGLFPPVEELRKPTGGKLRGTTRSISKKQSITARAKEDLERWLAEQPKADAA